MAKKRQSVSVGDLLTRFGGELVDPNEMKLKTRLTSPSLYRAGLELHGVCFHKKLRAIILWGHLESKFLQTLSLLEQEACIKQILQLKPPLIIVNQKFKYLSLMKRIIDRLQLVQPIIISNLSTDLIITLITPWLMKKLAPSVTVHGTLLNIYGIGVLIQGSPGIGKSEVAIELIKNNHLFVGDDAIDLSAVGNRVVGVAHPLTVDFAEVRGLGIVNIKKTFGVQSIIKSTNIHLVVELKAENELEEANVDRLGREIAYQKILGINIPYFVIPVKPGRNISDIVEFAVTIYKLHEYEKYNAAHEFNQRIIRS